MNQVFEVQGMSCQHCAHAVSQAVQAIDPQAQVQVDLNGQQVRVLSDAPRQAIAQAIADEGYQVSA